MTASPQKFLISIPFKFLASAWSISLIQFSIVSHHIKMYKTSLTYCNIKLLKNNIDVINCKIIAKQFAYKKFICLLIENSIEKFFSKVHVFFASVKVLNVKSCEFI